MKDEISNSLRREYKSKKENIDFFNRINEKLKELKDFLNDPDSVKRYIELTKIYKPEEAKNLTDDEILKSVLNNRTLISQIDYEDENGVWVCLGTYKYDVDRLAQTDRNDPKANFRKYFYLEGTIDQSITLDINECASFEEKHIIIFPKNNGQKELNRLQEKYLKSSVLSSPRKAKQYIKGLTEKNRKI